MRDLFEKLDGRKCTLDGVHGTLVREIVSVRYPTERTEYRLWHRASAKGRKSPAYLAIKARLRDDWDTDLTWSDRLSEIARKLKIEVG